MPVSVAAEGVCQITAANCAIDIEEVLLGLWMPSKNRCGVTTLTEIFVSGIHCLSACIENPTGITYPTNAKMLLVSPATRMVLLAVQLALDITAVMNCTVVLGGWPRLPRVSRRTFILPPAWLPHACLTDGS
jgi:hypothetical protein